MVSKKTSSERAEADQERGPTATTARTPSRRAPAAPKAKLIELRPGLFINVDHVVSVRMLPQDEGDDYAILQLSNGEKQTLTSAEFSLVTGAEPRPTTRGALVGSPDSEWLEPTTRQESEG